MDKKVNCCETLAYNFLSGSFQDLSFYNFSDIHIKKSDDQLIEVLQQLLLELLKPSIVKKIIFARNTIWKHFSIFGGLYDNQLVRLFEGCLQTEPYKQEFLVRHKFDEQLFPCKYIKIVIHSVWDTWSYSPWNIELIGFSDVELLSKCIFSFNKNLDDAATRHVLKFLRQHKYLSAFESLKNNTNVKLEDAILTQLHNSLVIEGDFESVEKLIEKAVTDGHLNEYVSDLEYDTIWTEITNNSEDSWPKRRGGHQMCIDILTGCIYMFGGWDGCVDMSDFWMFDTKCLKWTCISMNTELQYGPKPRSCHKMCIDYITKQIFILGQYVEQTSRTQEKLLSDFYVYNIEENAWRRISDDTSTEGGPQLIVDHQMTIDSNNHIIYLLGGRIHSSVDEVFKHEHSGFYSYEILKNKWSLIQKDNNDFCARIGHSLLFHDKMNSLFIYAGQRNREFCGDLIKFDIDKGELQYLYPCMDINRVASPGFTQRATISSETSEIFVLTGVNKENLRDEGSNYTLWIYNILKDKWSCAFNSRDVTLSNSIPSTRYAHQFIFDPIHKIHYLFGGNPGPDGSHKVRLNDFWTLKMTKPSIEAVRDRCLFMIRRQKFEEISSEDATAALTYLQQHLHPLLNSCDIQQIQQFNYLPSLLFEKSYNGSDNADEIWKSRSLLFDEISKFFPSSLTYPANELTHLMRLDPLDSLRKKIQPMDL